MKNVHNGSMLQGPRQVSCKRTLSHMCLLFRSATGCYFTTDSPSALIEIMVRAGPA